MIRTLYPLLVVIAIIIGSQALHESIAPVEWHCKDFEYRHRARSNMATVCVSQADTVVTDSGYGTTYPEFKQELIDSVTAQSQN